MLELAAALLGQHLVRRGRGGSQRVGRIVEVEAYGGQGVDPSAHSYKGPTPRCEVMFGPAGHAYVYATQGRCFCVNVSAEGNGQGRAVLLRAVEPVHGVSTMRARRLARLDEGPTRRLLLSGADHELARGPGRLCLCFDIDRAQDGLDLTSGEAPLWVAPGDPPPRIGWTRRIGLNPASASFAWRWRAIDLDARAVSAGKGATGKASPRPRPDRCPAAAGP